MPKQFVVGKSYFPYGDGFPPITIIKRTKKSILVNNGTTTWMMRIKHDASGNEYVIDSSVPAKWKECFTYDS